MDKQTNLQWLIDAATKYGYTEEQIVLICDEIGRAAYEQFAQEVERIFTPEEKQMLEGLSDKEKVAEELKRLYEEKTGQDAQIVINSYISHHINDFVEDHQTSVNSG